LAGVRPQKKEKIKKPLPQSGRGLKVLSIKKPALRTEGRVGRRETHQKLKVGFNHGRMAY